MLFRIVVFICFKVLFLAPSVLAQADTTKLILSVSQIQSTDDHVVFWQNLYTRDQAFRGDKTSRIKDLENLISASIYLNKFGYPSEDIKAGSAMPLIWIHNSYPKLKEVSFPLILAGYKKKQISEKDLRTYYIRNLYWIKFFNQENRTKDLNVLFAELNLNIEDTIDIRNIIEAYNESEKFLNQNFEIIGHWYNPKGGSPVKILKSEDGEYYFHRIHLDGSAYPQKVIQDEDLPSLFRNYYEPEIYFDIQKNGDLLVKNSFEKSTYKPLK